MPIEPPHLFMFLNLIPKHVEDKKTDQPIRQVIEAPFHCLKMSGRTQKNVNKMTEILLDDFCQGQRRSDEQKVGNKIRKRLFKLTKFCYISA